MRHQKFNGCDSREVIYNGFLPNIKINEEYIKKQLNCIVKNIAPPAYRQIEGETCDRNWDVQKLYGIQKKTLGI